MAQIKGKQILDKSIDVSKISGGVLPSDVTVGSAKTVADIIASESSTLTTKAFVEKVVDDIKEYGDKRYRKIIYVSPTGNDTTPNPDYLTINAATDAAALFYTETGVRPLVHVKEGVYNEYEICRNGVDMYFEEFAIIWTNLTGKSVISDANIAAPADGSLRSFNIYGKGQFYNTQADFSDDSNGINFRYNTLVEVLEFGATDVIGTWNQYPTTRPLKFLNGNVKVRATGAVTFYKCTFSTGEYYNNGAAKFYDTCEFILPADGGLSEWSIKDRAGVSVITLLPQSKTILDISLMSRQDIIDKQPAGIHVAEQIAAFEIRNILGQYNCHWKNCIMRIRRERCMGVRFTQMTNSTSANHQFMFDNLIILDETSDKSATPYVFSMEPDVTIPVNIGMNISNNCYESFGNITGWYPIKSNFKPDSISEEVIIEITGGTATGTGEVAYTGTINLIGIPKTDASVYVNALKTEPIIETFFSTPTDMALATPVKRKRPKTGDSLYFNITNIGYEIDADDLIEIKYFI